MNIKKLRENKSSKYKGVYHSDKCRNKGWRSQIVINGKKIYLGTFANEKDAAIAYNNKAL